MGGEAFQDLNIVTFTSFCCCCSLLCKYLYCDKCDKSICHYCHIWCVIQIHGHKCLCRAGLDSEEQEFQPLRRLKREHHKFKVCLGNLMRLSQKKQNKNNKNGN